MTTLKIDGTNYDVEAKFEMICEIEDELGGIVNLADKFLHDEWKFTELVTVMHIILNYIGHSCDFMELGNKMMREGLNDYLKFANSFLQSVISK